jgi:hypothetical protein
MSLQEQEYNESNNLILKLVSSETIICQVISDTEKNMIIQDPYEIRLHTIPTQKGMRSTVYYADWFLASKSRIHMLRKEHVMSAAIPDDTSLREYKAIVSQRGQSSQKPYSEDMNWDQDTFLDDQDNGRN